MKDEKCVKTYVVMQGSSWRQEDVNIVTKFKSTATRYVKDQAYVCHIIEAELVEINGEYYLPERYIPFTPPTKEDIEVEEVMQEKERLELLKQEVIMKALNLGLTQEDIEVIQTVSPF